MLGNTPLGVEHDEDDEWDAFDRLPASLRHYLSEECPVDFSSQDVAGELDDRGAGWLRDFLREDAVRVLNEEIALQRAEYPKLQWPRATLWNTRPIRRLTRKSVLSSAARL